MGILDPVVKQVLEIKKKIPEKYKDLTRVGCLGFNEYLITLEPYSEEAKKEILQAVGNINGITIVVQGEHFRAQEI